MYVFSPDDVDTALCDAVATLCMEGHTTPSRNGPQLRFPRPVTTVWSPSANIVSFDHIRDGNPFFSVIESLWMLAGRDDVMTPAFYASNIKNYSDDGVTLNSAYGHRWINHFGYDQLQFIIDELKANPTSRRCVLSMWNPYQDLKNQKSKDLSCNTHAYFDAGLGSLHMTVCNRSNDLIWGAYGANVVHFSFLHKFVADSLGIPLGNYYQVSNNLHVYPEFDVTKRFFDSSDESGKFKANQSWLRGILSCYPDSRRKGTEDFTSQYLREELPEFLSTTSAGTARTFKNSFLENVGKPLQIAYVIYKSGDKEGSYAYLDNASRNYDNAWLFAARAWTHRRLKKVAQ